MPSQAAGTIVMKSLKLAPTSVFRFAIMKMISAVRTRRPCLEKVCHPSLSLSVSLSSSGKCNQYFDTRPGETFPHVWVCVCTLPKLCAKVKGCIVLGPENCTEK